MDLLQPIWDFFLDEANQKAVASILGVLAALGTVWLYVTGRLGALLSWAFGNGDGGELGSGRTYTASDGAKAGIAEAPEGIATGQVRGVQTINQGPPPGHVMLSLDDYEARQERLRSTVMAEMEGKHGAERERLQAELDEVNRRLAAPDAAFEEAKARFAELEARLGNAESISAQDAQAALEKGDIDAARDAFERIAAETALEVKKNADAHFALGEIAEEDVRWNDAAEHYLKAARLDPKYRTYLRAGRLLEQAGRFPEALEHKEAAVASAQEAFGARSEERAIALNNLAGLLWATGRYVEAEPHFREALEIGRETLGDRHPGYGARLSNLAALLFSTGHSDEAERLYREGLEITRETLGERHPDYAKDLNNLAGLLDATGRTDEAERLYREALEITRETLGERHPAYATRLNNLGGLLEATGRTKEAEPHLRDALGIIRETLGKQHPNYAIHINNLAKLLGATGHGPRGRGRAALSGGAGNHPRDPRGAPSRLCDKSQQSGVAS